MSDESESPRFQELAEAIDEALKGELIVDAIQKIQDAGYDVFVVMEATIGFRPQQEIRGSTPPIAKPPRRSRRKRLSRPGELDLTEQDKKFFRDFKIDVNDDKKE